MWVVLSILLVMGILFFSFHLVVRNRNAQAHAVYFGEVSYGLAESAAALAWRGLRRHRGKPGSPLFEALVRPSAGALRGTDVPLDLEEDLARLVEGMGRDVAVEVTAKVLEAAPLAPRKKLDRGFDPLEKRAVVEVVAEGRFRGLRRRVVERRELRVQLDTLPVLSKFSLFVREPEREGGTDPGYNVYANDINGVPDSLTVPREENFLPLIVYNHGDRYARIDHDVEENGWVFLGGPAPVRLNLTSGADYLHGQYFHFFNFLANERSRQPAFRAADPPPFFRTLHAVGDRVHEYVLKHVIYGYFTVDRGSPPGDMNRNGLLARYFAGGGGNMRSSVLHLYGSFIAPSPTRVFGPVLQSYPIYTGVTVDVDEDGRRDGLVRLLPSVDAAGYAGVRNQASPAVVRSLSRKGEVIPLDPELLGMDRMFGAYEVYARYMSALVRSEPYNWGIDYIRSRGEFPIERPTLDRTRDYPNPGTRVTIARRGEVGPDAVHYEGDLHAFDPGVLEERALLRFRDAAAFERAFLRPREPLRLGVPVMIEEGGIDLPDRLLVERGGMIMARGDITFDGVTCEDGERLVLVSLEGDITSPFDHASEVDLAQVDLVALRGRVASTDPNHELAIRGILAARTLAPRDFKGGGRVVFPIEADPTNPERGRFARVHVADAPRSWGL